MPLVSTNATRQERGTRPVLSVAITAFNVAPYLGRAVRSVLDQTYPAAQIVVVDDGSSDDVEAVLADVSRDVTLIRQMNTGAAAAKNRAIRATDTDHIVLLDGDDWWEPRRLEALADLIAEFPDLAIATTDAFMVFDGVRNPATYYEGAGLWIDPGKPRESILRNNFLFSHALVRRGAWEAVGGFDDTFRNGSDRLCWSKMLLDGGAFGIVMDPLATYRKHATSVSANRLRAFEHRARLFEQLLQRDDLTHAEQQLLVPQAEQARTSWLMLRARQDVVNGAPTARRSSLAVARHAYCPWPTRIRAAAAALAPSIAQGRARQRAPAGLCQ